MSGARDSGAAGTRWLDVHSAGSAARGDAALAGHLRLAGVEIALADRDLWALPLPGPAPEAARQAFGWLDDLAAAGGSKARARAQDLTRSWLRRQGNGRGPGWSPLVAALRLRRLIDHAPWLTTGPAAVDPARLTASLARHARFLGRRWMAVPGDARFQTLGGALLAAATIDGLEPLRENAQNALETLCRDQIDALGGIGGRNPETLAEVFLLLARCSEALELGGQATLPQHRSAIYRTAAAVRALRHADGTLARFHGGSASDAARLDAALAALPRGALPPVPQAPMGYLRLSCGRSSVILDAAPPPPAAVVGPHNSALAFELTSGRRPLIVSMGPGQSFGAEAASESCSAHAHSRLVIAREGRGAAAHADLASDVQIDIDDGAASLVAAHNGYAARYGLIHVRRLDLSPEGRRLDGEDVLTALTQTEKRRFARALDRAAARGQDPAGLAFSLRFHLHPDVTALLDPGTGTASLTLASGEVWEFRHEGGATIRLDPGTYLDASLIAPRTCRQIVLSHHARGASTSIRWNLAKSPETPDFLRDLRDRRSEGPGS